MTVGGVMSGVSGCRRVFQISCWTYPAAPAAHRPRRRLAPARRPWTAHWRSYATADAPPGPACWPGPRSPPPDPTRDPSGRRRDRPILHRDPLGLARRPARSARRGTSPPGQAPDGHSSPEPADITDTPSHNSHNTSGLLTSPSTRRSSTASTSTRPSSTQPADGPHIRFSRGVPPRPTSGRFASLQRKRL